MFATVWGLRETRSTISRREILPCRLMTSRTMRRLYGALDCCVVPRLTIDCGGDYIHIQCVNWRESSAAGAWKTLRARRTADGPRMPVSLIRHPAVFSAELRCVGSNHAFLRHCGVCVAQH